jgi:hypothetical protein
VALWLAEMVVLAALLMQRVLVAMEAMEVTAGLLGVLILHQVNPAMADWEAMGAMVLTVALGRTGALALMGLQGLLLTLGSQQ